MRQYVYVLVLLCSVLLSISVSEAEPVRQDDWSYTITLQKSHYLPGEPILITITAQNHGQASMPSIHWRDIYVNDTLCIPEKEFGDAAVPPPGTTGSVKEPPRKYPPGYRIRIRLKLDRYCRWYIGQMDQGTKYERKVDWPRDLQHVCIGMDTKPVCVTFRIDEPYGVDRKVYSKLIKHRAYNDLLQYSNAFLSDLLDHYPTSTYAGWALLKADAGGPSSWYYYFNAKQIVDFMVLPAEQHRNRPSPGSYVAATKYIDVKRQARTAQKFISLVESFMAIHPDFLGARLLNTKISIAYMLLKRWQKAYQALDKAIHRNDIPWEWRMPVSKLEEIQHELEQRGLVKVSN